MNKYVMLGEILVAVMLYRENGVYTIIPNNVHMATPFNGYGEIGGLELIKRFLPQPCRDSIRVLNDGNGFVVKEFLKNRV